MNNILRYLLKGIGTLLIITIVPALIITILIVMMSSAFQTQVWINEVILPRSIGIIFFTLMFIGVCILMGKISEIDDAKGRLDA